MSSGAPSKRINKLHGVFDSETIFRSLTADEHLGRIFSFEVEVLSTKQDISPYDTIGQSIGIEIDAKPEPRFFHGIISHFEFVGSRGKYAVYRFVMKPWLWLLQHTRIAEYTSNSILRKSLNSYSVPRMGLRTTVETFEDLQGSRVLCSVSRIRLPICQPANGARGDLLLL